MRKSATLVLLSALVLTGCTGPITRDDNTPAGSIKRIEAMPKRPAQAEEQTAVLTVLRSLPGAQNARLRAMWVADSETPVRAFCALAEDAGPRDDLSGMLKTVDNKPLAFDFRFGDFAAQRCKAMGFIKPGSDPN